MIAYIFTGGTVNLKAINVDPEGNDIIIAADSGYNNAKALGEGVDILLGDFDSLGEPRDIPKRTEIMTVPSEKDFTDTQLAVQVALDKGANEVCIIGGLDGRLDHTLANLALLPTLAAMRVHAHINDGFNRVRYLNSSSTLIARSHYKYLSLIPISEKLRGVSIEGCKYPLKNATLTKREPTLTISNEIEGNCALISVRKGECYVIESAQA